MEQFGSREDPHLVMLRCNDLLITAFSCDPEGIAGVLLAKGLIPENTEAQVRQCSTPREKATILVKDIMEIMLLNSQSSSDIDDEDYTFPKLNSEDIAELEAQLIFRADSMRKKFATLLWSTVNSFKRQGIGPRELAIAILALTEYEDPAVGKPLLEREKAALVKAQTVDHIFDILRPHMTFFNYEILEFLIEKMGSSNNKENLQKFLHEFRQFCRQSVFEIPPDVLGHSAEKVIDQQKFCVKITKQFKAALLIQHTKESEPDLQTTSSTQLSSTQEDSGEICAPELGISLEDAKHIQRKFASILKLKVSSIFLDSVTSS